MKNSKRKKLRIGAFTLDELLVVISILAILATVGFLAFSGYSSDAKETTVKTNVRSVYSAITSESTVTGNSPRYYVIHDSGASLSGGIVVIDGNPTTLSGGDWNQTGTNYSAGNPDYAKLKINGEKFRISHVGFGTAYAAYDAKYLTVGAMDYASSTSASGKKRVSGFVQVAGVSSETNKASVAGNYPVGMTGSVTGLIKDPGSASSTGALTDGSAAVTPNCAAGTVWNGTACVVPPYSFTYVVSANTNNFNLRTAAIAAGWDQVKALSATVTVNA